VRSYRIYPLNIAGHIAAFGSNIDCVNDREACALAQEMLGGDGYAEVWQGARYVGQVSASEPDADRAT
jgi:hypothetical protein